MEKRAARLPVAAWGAAWGAVFCQGRSGRTEVNGVQVHFSNICKLLSVTAKEKLLGRKHQVFCAFLLLPKHTYSPGYLDGRNTGVQGCAAAVTPFSLPPSPQ